MALKRPLESLSDDQENRDTLLARAVHKSKRQIGLLATQSLFMLSSSENDLQKEVKTAEERPLRVYLDWGRYDLRGTREAWDMAETNRRFAAFLRERGYRPAGGETNDGAGWASW
jgi:hypothetical protein